MVRASNAFLDGGGHALQPPDPVEQHGVLPPEVGGCVGAAIGDDGFDVVEAEPELAVEQDPLQPLEIRIGVAPIASIRTRARGQ
jgi:hypothetical protein